MFLAHCVLALQTPMLLLHGSFRGIEFACSHGKGALLCEATCLVSCAVADFVPISKNNAEPDEIAKCVEFLATDDSFFMTGTHLVCDGGLSLKARASPGAWERETLK